MPGDALTRKIAFDPVTPGEFPFHPTPERPTVLNAGWLRQ
jgi:hypothetical protein